MKPVALLLSAFFYGGLIFLASFNPQSNALKWHISHHYDLVQPPLLTEQAVAAPTLAWGVGVMPLNDAFAQGLALACFGLLLCAMGSVLTLNKPALQRCELARTAQAAPKALPLRH